MFSEEGREMNDTMISIARKADPAARAALARRVFGHLWVPARARPASRAPRIGRAVRPVARVRGVLGEQVVLSTELDPFLSLKALASYSNLSVRKLHQHLEDPAHPLPCYRVGGKLLVRRSEFYAWVASFRRQGRVDVEQIVEDVLRDVTASGPRAPRRRS